MQFYKNYFLQFVILATVIAATQAVIAPTPYGGAAIVGQQSNILRSYGNLGQVSTYSKTIDTPFSSVSKSDVRVSNPGYGVHTAYPAAVHAAYPATYHGAYPAAYHGAYPAAYHGAYPAAYHGAYPAAYHGAYPAVAPVAKVAAPGGLLGKKNYS